MTADGPSMEERAKAIVDACLDETSANPYTVFENLAAKDFVRMHGPEHHILDGACLLTAIRNAGGEVDLQRALETLADRGLRMPGGMCGSWALCGSIASIGAAFSVMEDTGPLSADDSWGSHMGYSSKALAALASIGGPRCCKRNAYLSIETAIDYVQERFDIELEREEVICGHHHRNTQCIGARCPFNPERFGSTSSMS